MIKHVTPVHGRQTQSTSLSRKQHMRNFFLTKIIYASAAKHRRHPLLFYLVSFCNQMDLNTFKSYQSTMLLFLSTRHNHSKALYKNKKTYSKSSPHVESKDQHCSSPQADQSNIWVLFKIFRPPFRQLKHSSKFLLFPYEIEVSSRQSFPKLLHIPK